MYSVSSDFVLPTWIKPDDIASYYIKYDVLHLTLKDGRTYEVQPYSSATEDDLKRPNYDEKHDECDWYEEEGDEDLEELMGPQGARVQAIVDNMRKQKRDRELYEAEHITACMECGQDFAIKEITYIDHDPYCTTCALDHK